MSTEELAAKLNLEEIYFGLGGNDIFASSEPDWLPRGCNQLRSVGRRSVIVETEGDVAFLMQERIRVEEIGDTVDLGYKEAKKRLLRKAEHGGLTPSSRSSSSPPKSPRFDSRLKRKRSLRRGNYY